MKLATGGCEGELNEVRMHRITFEWDEKKSKKNLKKHKVSFEEAATVFCDPLSTTIYDEEHSALGKDRWIILGKSAKKRYLIVVHCESEDRIRILTARLATKRQIRDYEEETRNR